MAKNKSLDVKQYEKYKEIIGKENMPKTLAKFKDMKYNDVEKWEDLKGFYRYKMENANGNEASFNISRELKKLGLSKGIVLPAESIKAYILPDPNVKRDPYHVMHRMNERNITDDEIRGYTENAKIMMTQWGGKRKRYYSDDGISVISDTGNGWVYKTAWKKEDFDENTKK